MFRFTKWMEIQEELGYWEQWFASRGIKTEVRHEGIFWALFREGVEAVEVATVACLKCGKVEEGRI